jgi:hypothetical protein
VLGIRISVRSGRLQYGLAPEAIQALRNSLVDRDHGKWTPASARAAVLGWLAYIAPVYADTQRAARILREALIVTADSGYRDIADDSRLTAMIESATDRWNRLLHGSIVDDRSTSDVAEMHLAAEMRELRAPRVPNDRTALGARPAVAQDTPGPGVASFRFFP